MPHVLNAQQGQEVTTVTNHRAHISTLSCLPLNPLLMGMTSGCTALPCAWLHMGKCWTALWPGALGAGGQLSL